MKESGFEKSGFIASNPKWVLCFLHYVSPDENSVALFRQLLGRIFICQLSALFPISLGFL